MYSSRITSIYSALTERVTGTALREYAIWEVDEHLEALKKLEVDGVQPALHTLPQHLFAFVTNEQRLCAIDFNYWSQRYAKLVTDSRRLERFSPWPSQKFFLDRVAKEEERQYDLWQSIGGSEEFRFKGRFLYLKSRQVGATRVSAIIGAHLTYLFPNTYSLIASDTPEKGLELWRFWDKIYNSLPWFLAPSRETRVKGQEQYFAGLNSTLAVGSGNQRASFGQGLTIDFAHLTEVARWDSGVLDLIDKDLFWAFGSSRKSYSLCLLESTTEEGLGGWYEEQWDLSVKGKSQFVPTFLGWFLCPDKFKIDDPSIILTDQIQGIGKRIEERFNLTLTPAQLRWYQVNRAEMEAKGKLGEFFSQVPSFPEEAFQYGHTSVFPYDIQEKVKEDIEVPISVNKWEINEKMTAGDWDGDPETMDGKLVVWRRPEPGRLYVIGIDGSHGTNDGDAHAIEVLAVPFGREPAEEVAAWSARGGGLAGTSTVVAVAMALGNVYKGLDGRPAMIAPESNPGSPSAFVTQKLSEARYPNIYVHRRPTKIRGEQMREDLGWQTNQSTRTPLALNGIEGIVSGNLIVHSARVLEEMRSFEKKAQANLTAKYEHADKRHDDTLIALFIAYAVATEENIAMPALREAKRARLHTKAQIVIPAEGMITFSDEYPGDFNAANGDYPWTRDGRF